MKKISLSILMSVMTMFSFAQEQVQYAARRADAMIAQEKGGISNIPECFCCENAFNLPKPVIAVNGNVNATPKPVCACDPIKLSVGNCPGAKFDWQVKDNKGNVISYSPAGGAAITLTYGLAQQQASGATSITVTITISCNGKQVSSSIVIPLIPVPSANINFSLSTDAGGNTTATASTIATGNGNGWTLKEVNCPGPNPCSWVPGGIKWQSTGNTINIPAGVLIKGKCYVLTHYVNVCSPNWTVTPCTVYKATCFTVSGNQLKIAAPPAAQNDGETKLLPVEMLQEVQKANLQKEN